MVHNCTVDYERDEFGPVYYAQCSCGWRGEFRTTAELADNDFLDHLEKEQRHD